MNDELDCCVLNGLQYQCFSANSFWFFLYMKCFTIQMKGSILFCYFKQKFAMTDIDINEKKFLMQRVVEPGLPNIHQVLKIGNYINVVSELGESPKWRILIHYESRQVSYLVNVRYKRSIACLKSWKPPCCALHLSYFMI